MSREGLPEEIEEQVNKEFNSRHFCTQVLYIPFTQTHLDTDAFIHRRFYTQAPLHTDAFTCRRFYTHDTFTQTLLDTDAFTHRRF